MDFENLGTKQIEDILFGEISNWIRWGRKKDWLPVGFACPLGFLYVPILGEVYAEIAPDGTRLIERRSLPIDELEAVDFERVVVGLPSRHRQAFVMYHLGRAHEHGMLRIVKGRDEKARLLGVHKSQYYNLVKQAHSMILRSWRQMGGAPCPEY